MEAVVVLREENSKELSCCGPPLQRSYGSETNVKIVPYLDCTEYAILGINYQNQNTNYFACGRPIFSFMKQKTFYTMFYSEKYRCERFRGVSSKCAMRTKLDKQTRRTIQTNKLDEQTQADLKDGSLHQNKRRRREKKRREYSDGEKIRVYVSTAANTKLDCGRTQRDARYSESGLLIGQESDCCVARGVKYC